MRRCFIVFFIGCGVYGKKGWKIMTLERFIEKIKDALETYYGEKYCIKTLEVKKNNGVHLHGLSIFLQDGTNRITPTIYLDEFYDRYMGGVTLSETLREIIRIYEAHTVGDDLSMEFFLDYEKVRDRIVYKLINYQMNEELLKEIPHIVFLDLAVVFYYYMENEAFGAASILIYDAHIEKWGVSRKQLIADAKYNTPRVLGYRLTDMEEMMRELLRYDLKNRLFQKKKSRGQKEDREEFPVDEMTDKMMECLLEGQEDHLMYVLTNRNSQNGAACILYPDVLKEFAGRVESDLYILPSSVHEVILIKDNDMHDPDALRNMVKEVNRTQVEPEEVLSDQVYHYSRKSDRVELCECKSNVK